MQEVLPACLLSQVPCLSWACAGGLQSLAPATGEQAAQQQLTLDDQQMLDVAEPEEGAEQPTEPATASQVEHAL